mgnify:CR=1 FL=1
MMTTPKAVLNDTAENIVRMSRDLTYELAATTAAVLDARDEKTRIAKKFSTEIKALEKRQRELIAEIHSSGDTQLVMKFGSSVSTERAMAQSAPSGDEPEAPETDDETEAALDATH